jgi:hypothetical protein
VWLLKVQCGLSKISAGQSILVLVHEDLSMVIVWLELVHVGSYILMLDHAGLLNLTVVP